VAANWVFGWDTNVPWEFNCADGKLYRSVVTPWVTSGAPFAAAKTLFGDAISQRLGPWTPWVLLALPRVLLLALSWWMDRLLRGLFGPQMLTIFRGSWVTFLLMMRPFSNTIETMLVILAWDLSRRRRPVLLGMLAAFGVFSRVTFAAFFFPLGVSALLAEDDFARKAAAKKAHVRLLRIPNALQFIAKGAVGFAVASLFHIAADTWYARAEGCVEDAIQVTPWNNLLYNLDVANLEQHGLHPRYLHAAVNMQLLFSPVWIVGILTCQRSTETRVAISVIACALLVLSLAPHQEPRFLMPLVVPVSVVLANTPSPSARWKNAFKVLWVVFNLAIGVFYGAVHQAGIIPALATVSTSQDKICCVVTYETYMTPRFLMAGGDIEVYDLGGRQPDGPLLDVLQSPKCLASCSVALLPKTALVDFGWASSAISSAFGPHFCGERPPERAGDLELVLVPLG
ncbi:GPI mannosyltransferase 4 (GPI mannosyltransferase IV) (GPI-MT-IV), partial [Durusdinium trenchii]